MMARVAGFVKVVLERFGIHSAGYELSDCIDAAWKLAPKIVRRRTRANSKLNGSLKGGKATPPDSPRSSEGDSTSSPGPSDDRVRTGRINKKWPKDLPTKSPRSLRNPNNMCYRNSILQCLLHQPALYYYLEGVHAAPLSDNHQNDECTVCALQTLWKAYWHHESPTGRPPKKGLNAQTRSLNKALLHELSAGSTFEEDLKDDLQSDPFELLVHLIDCLKEHEKSDIAKGEDLEDHIGTSEVAADEPPSLDELFGVTLEQQWECIDCGNVTTKILPPEEAGHGIGLHVNMKQSKEFSLVQYLRLNTFVDTITIRCEDGECKQVQEETVGKLRQLRKIIRKAPEILIVRLGRFGHTKNNVPIKLSNYCSFEEYLNLGEFTEDGEPLFYRLDGVVAHEGTLQGGHYIAAVREQDERLFCTINDHRQPRKDATVDDLERPDWNNTAFDPYVLVYSKM